MHIIIPHTNTAEGCSLIRTFLASATKDAAVYEMSVEQAQMKKMWIDLVLSKEMFTFAPDDESLKRLVAQHRVFFDAVYSRMWN